jgi:hypothetical protein
VPPSPPPLSVSLSRGSCLSAAEAKAGARLGCAMSGPRQRVLWAARSVRAGPASRVRVSNSFLFLFFS